MIRWIVGASIQSRLMVVAIAVGLMAIGINQLRDVPVDIAPEFSRPYVEIQTEALGLAAAEVESLITVPLEADMLSGVSWVDEIRSESIPGLSSIVLIFEPGTDLLQARQAVQERLIGIHALPAVSKPPVMLNSVSSAGRTMMIGLSSEKLSLIEMSVLARWTIVPRLMGVDGVANVSIWGQRRRQLQVQVDPERLRDLNITLAQVISTAGNALWVSPLTYLNASTPGTTGFIDTPNQRLGVRHLLPISTPEQLAQVTVEGTTKRLSEVAEVVENHQPMIGDAIVNDEPSLMLVVEKFPWAHTLEVTRGVDKALAALQPGLIGLEMDPTLYRPATYLDMAVKNLTWALLLSGALVMIVLVAFLFDWRAALVGTIAILLSLVAAGVVLYLRGAAINAMVLAGFAIALAAVIDDAVIDTVSILRRIREHCRESSSKSFARIILESSLETRKPVIYATLILLLAVTPILFMDGVLGAFLQPVAYSYALALVASLVVALTVTPALSTMLLARAPSEPRESTPLAGLQRGYNAVLARLVHNPRPAFFAVCLIAIAGFATVPKLRDAFMLPTFKERDLMVKIEGAPGTSHPEMNRVARQATRELRAIPGIRKVSAQIGRAVMSDQVGDISQSSLWVSIDPMADYDATVENVRQVVQGYAGFDIDTQTYLEECTTSGRTVAEDNDLVVRIYGEDWAILAKKAEEVKQAVAKIDGISYAEKELPVEEPQVEIEVSLDSAKNHGLKPGDVRRAAATLLSGLEVGYLFEDQKVFDVVVWGSPKIRESMTNIRELLLDTPDGGHVKLEEVAEVRIKPSPSVIRHEAISRYVEVDTKVSGRDVGAVARDVEHSLKSIDFPLEYRAELLRGPAERMASRQRALSAAIACAIGMILVLQACSGSWRFATAMFFTLPAALVGGVLAAIVGGGALSLGSLFGLLAVLGLAVRHGIGMFMHYHHLAAMPADSHLSTTPLSVPLDLQLRFDAPDQTDAATIGPEIVQRGTSDLFKPVLMTAVATAMFVIPLLLLGDVPGSEILRPMSIAILGGLVTSVLFTLLGVPAIYLLFGPKTSPELEVFDISRPNEQEILEALAESRKRNASIQPTTISN